MNIQSERLIEYVHRSTGTLNITNLNTADKEKVDLYYRNSYEQNAHLCLVHFAVWSLNVLLQKMSAYNMSTVLC